MDPDTNVWTHNPHYYYYSLLHWDKVQQSHQNTCWGGKLETKHQTFINDCLSLSTIFHVFDWLNLVYLSDICISSVAGNVWWCRNVWQGLNIVENSPKPNHLSILEIGLEISLMLFRRREIGIEEGWMYALVYNKDRCRTLVHPLWCTTRCSGAE